MVGQSGVKKALTISVFLGPSLLALLAFSIGPMIGTVWVSFQEWNLIRDPASVGFGNYTELWGDEDFRTALKNTLYYLVGYLPLVMIGGLGLALLVHSKLKGIAVFRAMYFLPVVTSWVVVALLWKWLLSPSDGLVNWLLSLVGIDGPGWWTSRSWAMPSIILASAWKDLGFVMIILLAGLQGIDETLYEAARIDGAGAWRRLRSITLPMLTPSLFFVTVISLINGFQVFDQVWVMTGGGPAGSSTVVVEQIVKNTFSYGRAGYASAMSVVLVRDHSRGDRCADADAEALGVLWIATSRSTAAGPTSRSVPLPRRGPPRQAGAAGRPVRRACRLCAVVMIGPFVWMLLAALKTDADIRTIPPTLIPDPVTSDNFGRVDRSIQLLAFHGELRRRGDRVDDPPTRYCDHRRLRLRPDGVQGPQPLFGLYLATMMIPLQVVIVPLFIEMRQPRSRRQLRRTPAADDRVELRHLPDATGLPRPAEGTRRSSVHRRRQPLPGVLQGAAPAGQTGARDVRGVRLHVDLELVPVAARHHAGIGPARHPCRSGCPVSTVDSAPTGTS